LKVVPDNMVSKVELACLNHMVSKVELACVLEAQHVELELEHVGLELEHVGAFFLHHV
jgi:hypothetical protein